MNKSGLKAVAGAWIAIAVMFFVLKMIVEYPDTVGMVLTVGLGIAAFVIITVIAYGIGSGN